MELRINLLILQVHYRSHEAMAAPNIAIQGTMVVVKTLDCGD